MSKSSLFNNKYDLNTVTVFLKKSFVKNYEGQLIYCTKKEKEMVRRGINYINKIKERQWDPYFHAIYSKNNPFRYPTFREYFDAPIISEHNGLRMLS